MDKQEQMFSLIDEYRRSGLSAKRFCAEHGVRYTTLMYWIGKKRRTETDAGARGGFIPISLSSQSCPGKSIEIKYPNGVHISIPHFSIEQLRSLIHLI